MYKQKSQIINILRQLFSPDAVVDVGIGAGNGGMHQWRDWEVPLALMIDADPERVEWTQNWLERNKGWQLATVLLADDIEQQDFFVFSNRAESGVIAVKQLQKIWPNMQLREQKELQAQRLQDLLLSSSLQAVRDASCIWGVVDCLPALPILKGAGDELKKWSVLWVRVVLSDVFLDSDQRNLSSLAEVSNFLTPLGYRCIEVIEENQPALGYALFIQDWHKRYEESLLEKMQSKSVQQQQIEQLQQEGSLQSKQLEDYKAHIMKLEQQYQQQTVQTKQLEGYKTKIVELEQQCQQQIAQTKQLEGYKTQIVELEQQCQQREAQIKQLEVYKKQLEELQQRDYRQNLLDEEFNKAEAQLELIKDVLLKEKVL